MASAKQQELLADLQVLPTNLSFFLSLLVGFCAVCIAVSLGCIVSSAFQRQSFCKTKQSVLQDETQVTEVADQTQLTQVADQTQAAKPKVKSNILTRKLFV